MKQIKLLLFLFLTATIVSCSDSESNSYDLTNANIAGVYDMNSFIGELEANTVISGIPIIVKSNSVGDTFQIDFTVNSNGTYEISGQYRLVTTITSVGSTAETDTEIIDLDDSGSYTINEIDNEINFTSDSDEFLNGAFKVTRFNANSFTITQSMEEVEANVTANIKATIGFVRQ